MTSLYRHYSPNRFCRFQTIFLTAVILCISVKTGNADVSQVPSPINARFEGPEVVPPGSTISFKCSWLADDLVFRILWRIVPVLNHTGPLEFTLKNSIDEVPAALATSPTSELQGDLIVDTRNSLSILTLRNVTFAAEGNYTCSISSVTAEKQMTRSLRVMAPPDQIISRLNLSMDNRTFLEDGSSIGPYSEGTSFEINCFVAYSRPPATIHWLRRNREGQSFPLENQSGPQKQHMDSNGVWRVNRALFFRLDSRDLMGNLLICQAENEATTRPIQLSYRLNLLVPPANISLSLSGVGRRKQMREGNNYNITCETWDANPPAAIAWMLDREPVNRFVRNDTIQTMNGTFTTRSVFTYSANPDDQGKALTCIATQEVLTAQRRGMSDSVVLNILYSPRNIMTSRTELSVSEYLQPETDSTGGINCTADANPHAQYVWVRDGSVIGSGPLLFFNRSVTREDGGDYTCVATNEVGRTNITLKVEVHYRPYCSRCANASDPCLIGAAVGQEENIQCEMIAQPAADVQYIWNFNETDHLFNSEINHNFETPQNLDTSSASTSVLPITTSSINYTVRSPDDYRRLQCSAKNVVGTSLHPCYYRIVRAGPPHPPENCSILTIMTTGFSLRCKPGFDGGYPQNFTLSVLPANLADDSTGKTMTPAALSNSRVSTVIEPNESSYPEWLEKGLAAGREYQLEIVSRNEVGMSQPVYLPLRTLKPEEAAVTMSTTMVAAFAGSLGGFAFLALLASVAFLCVRRRKKGELRISRPEINREPTAHVVSETHSNNSSSNGSKSELVKDTPQQNGKHPDMDSGRKDGTNVASLRFQRNGSTKLEAPPADITYTRVLDLGKKPFKPAVAPKPPITIINGRSPDRTQYAVIDFAKNNKRTAPHPDDDLPHPDFSPKINGTNGSAVHDNNDGVIRTVAVV